MLVFPHHREILEPPLGEGSADKHAASGHLGVGLVQIGRVNMVGFVDIQNLDLDLGCFANNPSGGQFHPAGGVGQAGQLLPERSAKEGGEGGARDGNAGSVRDGPSAAGPQTSRGARHGGGIDRTEAQSRGSRGGGGSGDQPKNPASMCGDAEAEGGGGSEIRVLPKVADPRGGEANLGKGKGAGLG